jgi:hypothetical protein
VLARIHLLATLVWSGLAGGAAAGFLARDALGLRQPLVALAWTIGVVLALLPFAQRALGAGGGAGSTERGQATVEFALLVLFAALALGALASFAARLDGRAFAGFLAFRIRCTVERDCHRGDSALTHAYGDGDAALVRELAPNLVYEPGERQLPVDWRDCRRPACAEAPDEHDLDVHRSDAGERATAFTRLLRPGRRTYVQYWFYYPDSKTVWASSDRLWDGLWLSAHEHGLARRAPAYPGTHHDDWEAYVVRLDPDGRAWVRASSHGHWQGCKAGWCENEWTARTSWTRVSRGSHAGHIPLREELRGGPAMLPRYSPPPGTPPRRVHRIPLLPGYDLDERTSTSEGLRLIPLETLDARDYRPNAEDIKPPWQKDAYWDPESDDS